MSALSVRLDRFVRWFFNSSPTTTLIEFKEPAQPMRVERAEGARHGKAQAPRGRHKLRRTRSLQQRARA